MGANITSFFRADVGLSARSERLSLNAGAQKSPSAWAFFMQGSLAPPKSVGSVSAPLSAECCDFLAVAGGVEWAASVRA